MSPDTERQHTDSQRGVDYKFEPEQLSTRKPREHITHNTHHRQYENVDFGVAEEPKQILPQNRPTLREEEGGTEVPVCE